MKAVPAHTPVTWPRRVWRGRTPTGRASPPSSATAPGLEGTDFTRW